MISWLHGPGGDERIRTADPLRAKQVLSQLSYIPPGSSEGGFTPLPTVAPLSASPHV